MNDPVGEIPVLITADFSDLSDGIKQAESIASSGSKSIADAFSTAASGADNLSARVQALVDSGNTLGQALATIAQQDAAVSSSMAQVASAAQAATQPIVSLDKALADFAESSGVKAQTDAMSEALKEFADTAGTQVKPAVEEASKATFGWSDALKLLGVDLSARALKDFAVDALETFAAVEKATISITALSHGAEAAGLAISGLKDLAIQDALSFPALLTAEQRMLAFGVSAHQIPGALQAIADSAAATGRGFDAVANTFERVIESGVVQSRTLVNLGINMHDLASAMGVTEDAAKKAFAALDQTQRIQVLEQALQKFQGTAQAVAQGLSGQWQNFRTTLDFTFSDIGQAAAPVASAFLQIGTEGVRAADVIAQAFASVTTSGQHLGTALDTTVKNIEATHPQLAQLADSANISADGMDKAAIKTQALDAILGIIAPAFSIAKNQAEGFANVLDLINVKEPNTGKLLDDLRKHLEDITHASTTSGQAFKDAMTASSGVAESINKVSTAYTASVKAVSDARGAVEAYSQSLRDQKPLADGHIATQGEVKIANENLDKALQNLNGTQSSTIKSLADLQKAQRDSDTEVRQAITVWSSALQAYDQGRISAGLLGAAHEQLAKSIKAAQSAGVEMSTTLIGTWQQMGTAFDAFQKGLGAGALAIIQHQKNLQKEANDSATAFSQIAAASKTDIDAYNALGPAADALAKALKAAGMDASDLNTSLHLIGTDGIPVTTGGVTKLVGAGKDLDQVISDVNSKLREMGVTGDATMQVIKGGTTQNIELMSGYKDSVDAAVGSISVMHPKLLDADAAHRQLNSTAAQLPPIIDGSITAMDGLDDAIRKAGTDAAGLKATMDSVANSLQALDTGSGPGVFGDPYAQYGLSGQKLGNFQSLDPAHPERGGWVMKQGYGSNAEGGGGLILTYVEPQTLSSPGGTSAGGASAPISSPIASSSIPASASNTAAGVLAQIQGEVASGAIDLLHITSGQVQDFIKLMTDAGVSLDDAIKAMGGTAATTTQQISTGGTTVSQSFGLLTDATSQLSSTAQLAAPSLAGAVMSFTTLNTVVAATTDQLNAYSKSISLLQSQIDAANQKNAQDAASAYAANPHQAFFGQAAMYIDPSLLIPPSAPGPLGSSLATKGQSSGVPMNVTINNPVVRSQSDIDNLAKTLRDLGMT